MTAVADRAIREAGWEVFAPTQWCPATSPRRDATGAMRPGKPAHTVYLFVRYILVRFSLANQTWRGLLEEPGVERILSSGYLDGRPGTPIAVPDEAIAWVRGLSGFEANDCRYPDGIRDPEIAVGTKLRLLDGPLTDYAGVCAWSDGKRVMLLMNLLGRTVPVSLPQTSVETV